MDRLRIASTSDTPAVDMDWSTGWFKIKGISTSLACDVYFPSVLEFLSLYAKEGLEPVNFVFKLHYFNTKSAWWIRAIMIKLKEMVEAGKEVNVHWYYLERDEDVQELGEDFKEDYPMDFKLIEIPYDKS